jgi:Membrane protein involved in the export of O-antigen and teichoic acid
LSRAKLLLKNFATYGLVQALNKVIPLLLLPVITRLLPDTSDYAVFDMFSLILAFGTSLAVMGMYDAMFREYFEKEDQLFRYNVTTSAQRIVLISSLTLSLLLLVLNRSFSYLFFGTDGYGDIVAYASIAFFLSANVSIIQAPTRIQNKGKLFIVSGLLSSACMYVLSVVLLFLGYSYYGLIYSNIVASLVLLLFFWFLNKKYFTKGKINKKVTKELFKIGLPLLPTFIIYWVYNSMDRIMITNMLGVSDLGIYAIGSRVAQISMFIYMAFAGGWQYFAFSTMKDKDQVQLNSRVFEVLGLISIFSLILVYPFSHLIFSLLFTGEYIQGYIVFPYLYLSPLLLMLYQVVANQFLVVKKSYLSTLCLVSGAVINILLNLYLIKVLGVEGAAISTLVGYIVTLIITCVLTIKMNLFVVSMRFSMICMLTAAYLVVIRLYLFEERLFQSISSVLLLTIFVVLYKKETAMLLKKVNAMLLKKVKAGGRGNE